MSTDAGLRDPDDMTGLISESHVCGMDTSSKYASLSSADLAHFFDPTLPSVQDSMRADNGR